MAAQFCRSDASELIPMLDLIKILERSKPVRVPGTSVFRTNDPTSAPSSLMHNLKHNKVLHERVVLLNVRTETTPRVAAANRYEMKSLSSDCAGNASFRLYGASAYSTGDWWRCEGRTQTRHHDDVVLPGPTHAENSRQLGHAAWQDKLFIAMTKQAASAPDFFTCLRSRGRARGADEGLSNATPGRIGARR